MSWKNASDSSFPYERDGDVAVSSLNVPARLDPLTLDIQRGLRGRLARLCDEGTARALVLTGSAGSLPLEAQMHYEAERQRELIDRPEFAEGVKAFGEQRDPVFWRG